MREDPEAPHLLVRRQQPAAALAPRAFRVRVWHLMSRGRRPRVRYPNGSGADVGALFDSQNIVADSISIVLNDNSFSGGPATLTNGLVTEFVFVTVPMPPALILVLVGISAIAVTRRRK